MNPNHQYMSAFPTTQPNPAIVRPSTSCRSPARFLIALCWLAACLHTAAGAAPPPDAIVALDGSGQYTSVQDAIIKAPQTASAEKPWVILVKPGVYKELVYIQREKRFVRLVGEDAEKTTITFDLGSKMHGLDGKEIGTFRTPTVVVDADDFMIKNITLENKAGPVGPALAIRVDGDRDAFYNCRFVGFQDTMFLNRGRQYFENCSIIGATDFIFGGATAFFEKCHIHCTKDGYVTAASTPEFQPFGYVFSHCAITGETPKIKTHLGRPWRAFASVIFLNTEMSDVVRPEGWFNWGDPEREKTARYSEFNSTGLGASPTTRVSWSKQLSTVEAQKITVESVLGGIDHWKPVTQVGIQ